MNKHSRVASKIIIALRIAAVPPPLHVRIFFPRLSRKAAERESRIYLREKCAQNGRRRRRASRLAMKQRYKLHVPSLALSKRRATLELLARGARASLAPSPDRVSGSPPGSNRRDASGSRKIARSRRLHRRRIVAGTRGVRARYDAPPRVIESIDVISARQRHYVMQGVSCPSQSPSPIPPPPIIPSSRPIASPCPGIEGGGRGRSVAPVLCRCRDK